jgi:hypothetical protein
MQMVGPSLVELDTRNCQWLVLSKSSMKNLLSFVVLMVAGETDVQWFSTSATCLLEVQIGIEKACRNLAGQWRVGPVPTRYSAGKP